MLNTSKIVSILESSLFVWLGLALVFSLAGTGVVLPEWIQMIGRTHPLFLHFPIVLLLMGLLFYWIPGFRSKEENRHIGDLSFLIGSNFAGITILAGLILAQEDYEGEALFWHQWIGIGVFVCSILVYFFRDQNLKILKPVTLLLSLGILITGHLGANLTHGEDFLLAPIQTKEVEMIALSDAEVFRDMVQPILKAKCESCHKEGKIKGELRMDHLEGLRKGGKSGPFVVASNFKNSLLIQRINLPQEDKKHMPPINKPQLTDQEIDILMEWVASGASFEQKVEAIDPKSELFKLASLKFNSAKTYSFDPADPDDIEELNNFFRKVKPLSPESPALEASYFGISSFEPNSLKELLDVKNQLVILNLNKMPLKGVDLSFFDQFIHLEDLQLNFTDLESNQLKFLSGLKNLKNLALSGNQLDPESIKQLAQLKNLQNLYFWQNGWDKTSKEKLKKALPKTKINFGFDGKGIIYALNSPKIELAKNLFKDSIELKFSHPIKTVEIRYTLDGSEPDSISSPIYKKSVWLTKTAKIKAKSFAADWSSSENSEAVVMKSSVSPLKYELKTESSPVYRAFGAATLFDQIKGKNNHTSGEWLGFQGESLDLEIEIEKNKSIQELTIGMLIHEAAHIFPPSKIEIWSLREGKWVSIVNQIPKQSEKTRESRTEILTYNFETPQNGKIRVKITPLAQLPKWHPSPGSKGWLFVDEILLN